MLVFFVDSEEEFALCPHCNSFLEYHCRIIRPLRDSSGAKNLYNIRVMKCCDESCPTNFHRELPNIIIPYKRYSAESIEEVIEHRRSEITVAADESTIWRWRKWFKSSAVYIMMALFSVAAVNGESTNISSLEIQEKPIETIKRILARKIKWLNEAVKILVNSSKWVFNRSAFLSG